jgi:hypothetical protein
MAKKINIYVGFYQKEAVTYHKFFTIYIYTALSGLCYKYCNRLNSEMEKS